MSRVIGRALFAMGLVASLVGCAGRNHEERRAHTPADEKPPKHEKVVVPDPDPKDPVFMKSIGERPRQALEVEGQLVGGDVVKTQVPNTTDRQSVGHGAGGIGVRYDPFIPRTAPEARLLGFSTMFLFGTIGDVRHGFWHIQNGYRPRIMLPADGVDLFIEGRVLHTLSGLRGPGAPVGHTFDFGGGLGIRVLDSLSALVWTDAVYSLDDSFHAPYESSGGLSWIPRAGLNASVDICFLAGLAGKKGDWCRYPAPVTRSVDLTPILNAALAHAAKLAPPRDKATCETVRTVTSVAAPDCESGADADCFFGRLCSAPLPAKYIEALEDARAVHEKLKQCLIQNRTDATLAQLNGWLMRVRVQYGAYPPEMSRSLACEPENLPDAIDGDDLEQACAACPEACRARPWFEPIH